MSTRIINPRQMAFDLFPIKRSNVLTEGWAVSWLMECHGCTEEVREYVHALYTKFEPSEAFKRCKALTSCNGKHKLPCWELQDAVEYFGIYDGSLDYHIIWDRRWAVQKGYRRNQVLRIIEWDYRANEPIWKE